MYELSEQEETILIIMIKNIRIDYLKKNKYIFKELPLLEDYLDSENTVEKEIEYILDNEIEADKFENIFADRTMSKIVKALAYDEKLVLFLYYKQDKTDREIGEIFSISRSAANKRRLKIEDKIAEKLSKGGIKYVQQLQFNRRRNNRNNKKV